MDATFYLFYELVLECDVQYIQGYMQYDQPFHIQTQYFAGVHWEQPGIKVVVCRECQSSNLKTQHQTEFNGVFISYVWLSCHQHNYYLSWLNLRKRPHILWCSTDDFF